MTRNLQPVPKEKHFLRYRDRPEGEVVSVEIQYMKGSSPRNRGLYLIVRPDTVEADGTWSTMLLSGHRARICSLDRASPRLLQRIAEYADDRVADVAAAFRRAENQGKTEFDALVAELARFAAGVLATA